MWEEGSCPQGRYCEGRVGVDGLDGDHLVEEVVAGAEVGEFVQSSRKEDHSLKQDGLSQQRTHGITVLAQCGRPEVFGDS